MLLPLLQARQLHTDTTLTDVDRDAETERTDRRGVMIGATIMVLTQLIMVAIMTMTPAGRTPAPAAQRVIHAAASSVREFGKF